ncbi:MAG: LptF/LptG family permease [Gemmatimonadaceae bacterium]|jgi:lipopolysaccharide export system permease protein
MRRRLRPLDRYVLHEFWRVLVATALGFPLLVIIIDLSEKLDSYLGRELPPMDIALAYLFGIADTMFLVLPAAVLFATVFTIGNFTRHSEITAAKASGISFHRFIAPIAVGAVGVTLFGLLLSEVVPPLNARRLELLQEKAFRNADQRANFAYASETGRVYRISQASVTGGTVEGVEIERRGTGPDYPTYVIAAGRGAWQGAEGWMLRDGVLHLLPDSLSNLTFHFDSLRDAGFREPPASLMANPKAPAEMGYRDLGRFIEAMERSGTNVNKLRVERMLKIAIPFTSVIIMLIGAPLATSTQRGGTAYGIGISLAITVVFLMMIQLTQAIGAGGLVQPELAAWLPGAFFGVLGSVLLYRVRT